MATGTTPQNVATGDINGDGKIDAAISNSGSNTVSIYLNTGSGLPAAASYSVTTGTTPRGIALADFTGDGRLDMAVANSGATTVSVYNNSGGTLPGTANYTLASMNGPTNVTAGDLNRDGRPDLVGVSNSSIVRVILNSGGTLSGGTTYSPGATPFDSSMLDFDGDGDLDLAVTTTAGLATLINNGSGSFSGTSLRNMSPASPKYIVTADFNMDGKPDVAMSNSSANYISIFLNTGWAIPATATSNIVVSSGVSVTPFGITADDFNGDGKPDIATGSISGIAMLYNPGDGLFPSIPSATLSATADSPAEIADADFNGDGLNDLIVTNNTSANTASIYISQNTVSTGTATINQGNGKTGLQINLAPGTSNDAFTIVDTNGNNLVEVDSSGKTTLGSSSPVGSSFTNNKYDSGGQFGPHGSATGDFNGDGLADVATVNNTSVGGANTGVTIYLNQGYYITPVAYTLTAGGNPTNATVGDFNGDGRADLAVANLGSNSVSVYINTGTALPTTATYSMATGANAPWGVVAADFNNDGRTDLVSVNHTTTGANGASVYYNSGTSVFVGATNLTTGNAPYGVAAGDFNGDSKMDLVVTNNTGNSLSVYLNNGTSLPTTANSTLALGTTAPLSPATGDFNGDGRLDLAITNQTAGGISILINSGTGTPLNAVTYSLTAGTTPDFLTANDFNGDGKTDLAVTNAGSNNLMVYTNTGTALPTTASLTITTSNVPLGITSPDINNDGKPDIVVANSTAVTTSVFLNTSASPARLKIAPAKPTESGLVIQGASGQSADYIHLQTNNGTSFFEVRAQQGAILTNYSPANAILYIGADSASGRSISAAGSVAVNGADYAEYIPWDGEKPPVGSIVHYKGSNYVVSSPQTAAFIGNDKFSESTGLLVTFAGQVPVRVTGPVVEGDILVPNGDGTAKAVSPTQASVSDAFNKVAIAQEDNSDPGVKLVMAAVGTTASMPTNLQGSAGDFSDLNVGSNATIGGDLTVTGTATIGELHVTGSAQFSGDITVGGHIITASGEPTTELQVAAGDAANVDIDGNDTTGTITITTGATPATGELLKVLFSQSYGAPPRIILSPSNDNAASLKYFKGNTSTADFMFNALDTPQANTTYKFDYFIAQ